jgi:hypothetical protein
MQQTPAFAQIKWFRTAYVPAEDRLRLECALVDGSAVIWLTQRMANVLVKNLLAWLDKTVPAEQAEHFGDIPHRVAQQKAMADRPERRTEKIPEAEPWLVDAIDLNPAPGHILLTFKNKAGGGARIQFDQRRLRLWLGGLYNQYRRSGWPLELWPEWIGDETVEAAVPTGLLH